MTSLILLFVVGTNMGRTLCFRPYSCTSSLGGIVPSIFSYVHVSFRRQTRRNRTLAGGFSKVMSMITDWSAVGGKHQQAWRILAGKVDLLCVSTKINEYSHFHSYLCCLVNSTGLRSSPRL
jgi:hypothetical protein